MTHQRDERATVPPFDAAMVALVRLSAHITAGSESDVRGGLRECALAHVPPGWLEELILQSYLFAGLPRALNAARAWRRASDSPERRAQPTALVEDAGPEGTSYANVHDWRTRGEETCERVYAGNYGKLRSHIRELHPALDEWMIVEGYGKVLSRPGLDLARRELCIIAACAAAGQERQLHSHLLGAVHAGATPAAVRSTLEALRGVITGDAYDAAVRLWDRLSGSGEA